jgi:hypothetical protein
MKLIHIADTHLGLAAFSRLDPESGMNLRDWRGSAESDLFIRIGRMRRFLQEIFEPRTMRRIRKDSSRKQIFDFTCNNNSSGFAQ